MAPACQDRVKTFFVFPPFAWSCNHIWHVEIDKVSLDHAPHRKDRIKTSNNAGLIQYSFSLCSLRITYHT